MTRPARRMAVTLVTTRPSNDVQVHAAGCADIHRGIARREIDIAGHMITTDRATVIGEWWQDIIRERGGSPDDEIRDLQSETRFFPCTSRLPYRATGDAIVP